MKLHFIALDSKPLQLVRGAIVSKTQQNVLIVDDERVTAETLVVIFSHRGYRAQCAHSAEDALELIVHWVPDFAILDVMLPGMDGIALAIVMKQRYPKCKVLLFSGCADTEDLLIRAQSDGHEFEILAKPAHPMSLLDAAVRMLAA